MINTAAIGSRYRRALTAVPSARDWQLTILLLLGFAALTGALDFATGMIRLHPVEPLTMARLFASTLIIPALAEELLFRGYLPGGKETKRPWLWIAGSTAVFVFWHVVQTWVLKGAGPIFLRGDFLASSALLGLVCANLRMRTGSLWPGVAVHWIVVFGWLTVLGGPSPSQLLGRA